VRRYKDLNSYLKAIYGERVQKIPLDSGLICPNRDGTISNRGCIFCDARGSGTGAMIDRGQSIDSQITSAREFLNKRYGVRKFIAYFQSFTNTYGPVQKLKEIYDQALVHPDMVGLSVATRPDCIDQDKLDLLCSYQKKGLVWLELGLQSAHDSTLKIINRGHNVACFEKSVFMAAGRGLGICAHVILGLPGETRQMMLQTARFLAGLPIDGVKIHLLYIVKGTLLEKLYLKGDFACLAREEYIDLVVDFLELLPPVMIVHRLTGDPPRSELVAPEWAREKMKNLQMIEGKMEERNTWQGAKYKGVGRFLF
jgi:radical SAM protein (TIGR01212 family)